MTVRTIRTLNAAEVETLVDWAAGEGWNPGLGDATAFHAADPYGFIGAFVGKEMVAGISAVAYGDDFGFIGLYICRPDRRGEGHGKAVWDAGIARLGSRTIGLDGVAEQRDNYRRMGFAPAYETTRYSGRMVASVNAGSSIGLVTPALVSQILAYDLRCFPASRQSFLEQWLQSPRNALAVEIAGEISGYGVVRPCRDGFKIGPLFADDTDAAGLLLEGLAKFSEGGDLHIDVPATNTIFIAALDSAGFSPGFTTTRMYKGAIPRNAQYKVFGITSLELG
jgi:hypothetical protein